MTLAPSISSLKELKVEISSDAHDYLKKQLDIDLEITAKLQKNQNNGEYQLNSIIEAMKTSSRITLCRVNLILTNREEIIRELYKVLKPWHIERLNLMRERNNGFVPLSSIDKMNIPDDNFELQITPHNIFEDCIEIQLVQMKQDSSKAEYTKATGLVLSPHHSQPPPSKTPTYVSGLVSTPKISEKVIIPNNIVNNNFTYRNRLSSMPTEKRARRIELGWPDSHRVIICDRFCGEAVLRGSEIFVRGIICADSGVRNGEEVAVGLIQILSNKIKQ